MSDNTGEVATRKITAIAEAGFNIKGPLIVNGDLKLNTSTETERIQTLKGRLLIHRPYSNLSAGKNNVNYFENIASGLSCAETCINNIGESNAGIYSSVYKADIKGCWCNNGAYNAQASNWNATGNYHDSYIIM